MLPMIVFQSLLNRLGGFRNAQRDVVNAVGDGEMQVAGAAVRLLGLWQGSYVLQYDNYKGFVLLVHEVIYP